MATTTLPSLDCIRQSSLTEIAALRTPPSLLAMVVSATMAALGKSESWADAKLVIKSNAFLVDLKSFDPAAMSPVHLSAMQVYTTHADFNRPKAERCSVAAGDLCEWCLAVEQIAAAAATPPSVVAASDVKETAAPSS